MPEAVAFRDAFSLGRMPVGRDLHPGQSVLLVVDADVAVSSLNERRAEGLASVLA